MDDRDDLGGLWMTRDDYRTPGNDYGRPGMCWDD